MLGVPAPLSPSAGSLSFRPSLRPRRFLRLRHHRRLAPSPPSPLSHHPSPRTLTQPSQPPPSLDASADERSSQDSTTDLKEPAKVRALKKRPLILSLARKAPGAELADLQPYLLMRSSLQCAGGALVIAALLVNLSCRSSRSFSSCSLTPRLGQELAELLVQETQGPRNTMVKKESHGSGRISCYRGFQPPLPSLLLCSGLTCIRLIIEVGSAFLCSAKLISGVGESVLYGQDRLGVVALRSVRLYRQLTWVAALNFYVALANIVILRLRLHMASLELFLDSLMAAFKSLHSHDSYFIGLIGFVVLWFHWFFQCLSTILPPPGCHLDFFKSTGGILFLIVTHAPSAYLSGAEDVHHLQAMVSCISIIVWINYLTSAWSSCSATASHMLGAFEALHVVFQSLVDIFTSRLLDLLSRKAGMEAPLLSPLSLPSSWCLHYISCTRKIIWTFSDVILSFPHYLVDVITLSY